MSQWAMNENVTFLIQKTHCSLNVGDINSNTEECKRKDFDANIHLKLCGSLSPLKDPI